ncbi:efflux RND transporter periplasmic adaptor subunit [uncultured Friedmanniella sp.]|uniref:efflux RND transporter periplasmic adaptor subunit n=1 Tax=uncultured Friedmanniella sp. TaxID=335381 RepID=UPI0035C9B839
MSLQQADSELGAEEQDALGLPDQAAAEAEVATPTPQAPRRPRRRLRWLLIGLLVLLLAGAGLAVWARFFRTTDAATTTYRTVTVSAATLKQTVSGTGTLNPASEADLSFSSSGTVSKVSVGVGDKVTKGETLARIDDSELAIDLDSAKASLTEADDALATLDDDSDSTATAIAAAEATVKVKQNAVTQAKAALEAATLTSPLTGTVAAVDISKGDTVSGGSSTTSSTGGSGSSSTSAGAATGSTSTSSSSAITVISTGTFDVTTSVSNADLTSVKKGLQATITPTSSATTVFGTVTSVGVVASSSSSTSGSTSTGSSTFPVVIHVTGTHKDLLPGSSATVSITVKQLANALSVPAQAVTTVDGKTVVQKLVDGKQVPTVVVLGDTISGSTVVTSGLSSGDQVVAASFRAATTGTGTGGGTGQQGGTGGFPGGGTGGFPGGGTGGFPGGGTGGTGTGAGTGGTR